ncbi:Pleiotropic ABC efflux transporter of multiple drugs YBT1 [Paramyrothecium foliicola]|nr:Pleiotropic ABC efflux transporter of multiple drugs YBT1 [Paramyrothecium foliicola]
MPVVETGIQNADNVKSHGESNEVGFDPTSGDGEPASGRPFRKLIQDETHAKGSVKNQIYLAYLRGSGGLSWWSACVLVLLSYQVSAISRAWWLRVWTAQNFTNDPYPGIATHSVYSKVVAVSQQSFDNTAVQYDVFYYLTIYIVLSVVMAGIGILRYFGIYRLAINATLANRWMSFRMALIAAFFCVIVGVVIIFNHSIDGALAGFALSFILDFSESIRWTITCYGDIELDMNSMELVHGYMSLEAGPFDGQKPPAACLRSGSIELNNLEAACGPESPLILKQLSFKVSHGERIRVVGRTGAGKSSLALALFRCLEVRSGSIIIDGLDIPKVNLQDLRSRLFIVPQDPVLFSVTVRSNLDPPEEHTDSEIFMTLE